MSNADKPLIVLLRLEALLLSLAAGAVFLPTNWMETIHGWVGMGAFPRAPIVEYLTRSLSAMYALSAPVHWLLSTDIKRYLPLVSLKAVLELIFGMGMLGLDLWASMPTSWTVSEGPVIVLLGGTTLVLVRRVERIR